jgi:hypothetical protein
MNGKQGNVVLTDSGRIKSTFALILLWLATVNPEAQLSSKPPGDIAVLSADLQTSWWQNPPHGVNSPP